MNAFQTCICANRILVQENIHDEFVAELTKAMKEQLRVGCGFDQKTTQGPLINQNSVDKVIFFSIGMNWIYFLMIMKLQLQI